MPISRPPDDSHGPKTKLTSQDRAREWALEIFRHRELAERYLNRANRIFRGRTPLEVARTHAGANWVIEELTDAAYGTPILPSTTRGKAPRPPAR